MNITSDDPRLTAYALDELDEAGRSVIETDMQNFGECHCEVEEIRRVAALVRAELAREPAPALTPVQHRAIEASLRHSGSKWGLSWTPSLGRSRTGLAMVNALQICLVSFPVVMPAAILAFFQNASADTAYVLLKMAGARVIKDGLKFTFPAYATSLRVAPECSTIDSSLVLLVASVLLGYLYLRSPWKRVLLTLFVIPLVIVKDGIRLFTIAELFTQMGAHGREFLGFRLDGSIFFALSLIPFLLFLVWLRKLESKP
jgi:exosortase/archaeosortase family protein